MLVLNLGKALLPVASPDTALFPGSAALPGIPAGRTSAPKGPWRSPKVPETPALPVGWEPCEWRRQVSGCVQPAFTAGAGRMSHAAPGLMTKPGLAACLSFPISKRRGPSPSCGKQPPRCREGRAAQPPRHGAARTRLSWHLRPRTVLLRPRFLASSHEVTAGRAGRAGWCPEAGVRGWCGAGTCSWKTKPVWGNTRNLPSASALPFGSGARAAGEKPVLSASAAPSGAAPPADTGYGHLEGLTRGLVPGLSV